MVVICLWNLCTKPPRFHLVPLRHQQHSGLSTSIATIMPGVNFVQDLIAGTTAGVTGTSLFIPFPEPLSTAPKCSGMSEESAISLSPHWELARLQCEFTGSLSCFVRCGSGSSCRYSQGTLQSNDVGVRQAVTWQAGSEGASETESETGCH